MSFSFPISAKQLRSYRQEDYIRKKKDWITYWVRRISSDVISRARSGYVYYKGPSLSADIDADIFPMMEPIASSHVDELMTALKTNFPDSRIYIFDNYLMIDWCDLCDANESDHKVE
jgi:hypothetical protein